MLTNQMYFLKYILLGYLVYCLPPMVEYQVRRRFLPVFLTAATPESRIVLACSRCSVSIHCITRILNQVNESVWVWGNKQVLMLEPSSLTHTEDNSGHETGELGGI